MIWTLYDKIRRLISRLYYRLLGNKIQVGKNSQAIGLRVGCFDRNNIVLLGESKLILEDDVVLKGCDIKLIDSELYIKKDSHLDNVKLEMVSSKCEFSKKVSILRYSISIFQSQFSVRDYTQLKREEPFRSTILIDNSQLVIGNNNVIKCDFAIRFGGVCSIGQYNCINEGSDLRCDQSITIGDYNMISYNCNIWDTNTHTMYGANYRRNLLLEYSSNIGAEKESPKTKPVIIGNDCWISKNVSILKGTNVDDEVVIGLGSILSNQIVKKGQVVVPHKAIILTK